MQAMCSGGSDRPEVGVALVRADHEPAGLRDGEVHAGQAGLRLQELLRAGARGRASVRYCRVGRALLACRAARGTARRSPPSSGGSPAARCGSAARSRELHDALAEIGVDDFDPVPLEERIEVALLGEHRLALHEPRDAAPLEDARGRSRCARRRRAAQWTCAPRARGVALELLEVVGRGARACAALIAAAALAQRLPVRQRARPRSRFVRTNHSAWSCQCARASSATKRAAASAWPPWRGRELAQVLSAARQAHSAGEESCSSVAGSRRRASLAAASSAGSVHRGA